MYIIGQFFYFFLTTLTHLIRSLEIVSEDLSSMSQLMSSYVQVKLHSNRHKSTEIANTYLISYSMKGTLRKKVSLSFINTDTQYSVRI